MLHAVIMAGGAGTRFWPASRTLRPKQLLDLVGGRTMIQSTLDRIETLVPPERTLIVTNAQLVSAIAEQLPQLPASSILGEPCKRDTAPCIGLAAALIRRSDPNGIMIVMPSDHVIQPVDAFRQAMMTAARMVEDQPSRIVTFGILPTYPAESFGYIERDDAVPVPEEVSNKLSAYRVRRFREKPNAATAAEYLATGNFYWNSGIFVWRAATIDDALAKFEPEMSVHLRTIAEAAGSPEFGTVLKDTFAAIRGKSIDYAVMEQYPDVTVIEAPFTWDDVGSWQSLARLQGGTTDGNTSIGRHLPVQTTGSIVRSDNQHLVVTLGMKDCLVVHTPDATLVANRQDEEAIRKVVELLKERGWMEYL